MPRQKQPRAGRVIWITGLSGSGKTTLAQALARKMRAGGMPAIVLDGDEMRAALGREKAHTRVERLELARCYGRLGSLIARQGTNVIVATISLFSEIHRWNRRNLPNYTEIYLKADLSLLHHRDPKGIYRKARARRLANVAGMDLRVQEPQAPHLVIEQTGGNKVQGDVAAIMQFISGRRKK